MSACSCSTIDNFEQLVPAASLLMRLLAAQGASSRGPAHDALGRLLVLRQPPTAIVTGNNYMTSGVLQALREQRVAIPTRAHRPTS